MPPRLKLITLLAATGLCSLAFAASAQADFEVTDNGDAGDPNLNGFCDTTGGTNDTPCTLRAAIQEANFVAGADLITFDGSVTSPISIGAVPLNPTSEMTIDGNGSGAAMGNTVISGSNANGLFITSTTATPFTLKDLRLTEALISTAGTGGGSALQTNSASTTLTNVVVTSSTTTGAGNGRGAVWSVQSGTLTIQDSVISDNMVTSTGNNAGAGINSSGPVSITNSVISGNQITAGTAQQGGGVAADGGFTLDKTTIRSNSVAGGAATTAGGLFNGGNAGTRTITNSTISGNSGTSASSAAGGLFLGGDTTSTNVTLTANSASNPGADVFAQGAGTDVTAQNTIFGSNQACGANGGAIVPAMPGHNIDVGTSCNLGMLNGNMESTNPDIFFAQAGVPLHTVFIPTATSPAIDNADPSCGGGLTLDHRGVARPQGPACDIGAYERDYRDLNVLVAGSGTVMGTGINCVNGGGDCTHEFLDGSPGFVLTATPAAGFQFSSWTAVGGGCSSITGNQCTVETGNDRMITATFTAVPVVTPPATPPVTTPTTPTAPKKCKKGRKLKKGKCVKKKRKRK